MRDSICNLSINLYSLVKTGRDTEEAIHTSHKNRKEPKIIHHSGNALHNHHSVPLTPNTSEWERCKTLTSVCKDMKQKEFTVLWAMRHHQESALEKHIHACGQTFPMGRHRVGAREPKELRDHTCPVARGWFLSNYTRIWTIITATTPCWTKAFISAQSHQYPGWRSWNGEISDDVCVCTVEHATKTIAGPHYI